MYLGYSICCTPKMWTFKELSKDQNKQGLSDLTSGLAKMAKKLQEEWRFSLRGCGQKAKRLGVVYPHSRLYTYARRDLIGLEWSKTSFVPLQVTLQQNQRFPGLGHLVPVKNQKVSVHYKLRQTSEIYNLHD